MKLPREREVASTRKLKRLSGMLGRTRLHISVIGSRYSLVHLNCVLTLLKRRGKNLSEEVINLK